MVTNGTLIMGIDDKWSMFNSYVKLPGCLIYPPYPLVKVYIAMENHPDSYRMGPPSYKLVYKPD